MLYKRTLFMYSLSPNSHERINVLTQAVAEQTTLSPLELQTQAQQLVLEDTHTGRVHRLWEASARSTDPKAQPYQRLVARYAMFYAAKLFNQDPAATSASLGFMDLHCRQETTPVVNEEMLAISAVTEDFNRCITSPAHTSYAPQPTEDVPGTFAYYLKLAELLHEGGPNALLRLMHMYNITHPTRYPVSMLVDQLKRIHADNSRQIQKEPQVLVLVGSDDQWGSLTDDPLYAAVAKACAASKTTVHPTIVEFDWFASTLVEHLAQNRTIAAGFLNAHGNWDNIDDIGKDELQEAVDKLNAREAIVQNWRNSGGLALLSCHGGAVCSKTGEEGMDATLATLLQKPVIASDDYTYHTNVRRRSTSTETWTVEFHVPEGHERTATISTPGGYKPHSEIIKLYGKTVFRKNWLPDNDEAIL